MDKFESVWIRFLVTSVFWSILFKYLVTNFPYMFILQRKWLDNTLDLEKQTYTGSLRTFLFCSIFTILAFICSKSTRKTSELRHWYFKRFLHNSSGPLLLVVWLLVKRFVLLTYSVGKISSLKFFRKTLGQSLYKDAFLLLFFSFDYGKNRGWKRTKNPKNWKTFGKIVT